MPAPGRAGARRGTSTGTPAPGWPATRPNISAATRNGWNPGRSFDIFFDPYYRRVDPVLYHDIEAGFKFDSGVTVRAAITNVTDEDPPYLNIAPANTDVATYRLLGRSYFLELRYQVEWSLVREPRVALIGPRANVPPGCPGCCGFHVLPFCGTRSGGRGRSVAGATGVRLARHCHGHIVAIADSRC